MQRWPASRALTKHALFIQRPSNFLSGEPADTKMFWKARRLQGIDAYREAANKQWEYSEPLGRCYLAGQQGKTVS